MRYWGTESRVSQSTAGTRRTRSTSAAGPRTSRSSREARPAPTSRANSSTKSKVAGGGSVQPFLRKVYRHQAIVSGPLQRVLLLLVLAGILYAFVLGDSGAIRIAILRHQRAQIDQDIAELEYSTALLQNEIDRLRDDATYIEKLGREHFGYIRGGERVFKLVPHPDREK